MKNIGQFILTERKRFVFFLFLGRCKLGVFMDGINSMFTEKSIYKRDDFDFYTKDRFSYIPAQSFTLVQAFTNMLNNDWVSGFSRVTLSCLLLYAMW